MSLSFWNILLQSCHTSRNTQQTFRVRLCSIGAVNQCERCGCEFLVAPTYSWGDLEGCGHPWISHEFPNCLLLILPSYLPNKRCLKPPPRNFLASAPIGSRSPPSVCVFCLFGSSTPLFGTRHCHQLCSFKKQSFRRALQGGPTVTSYRGELNHSEAQLFSVICEGLVITPLVTIK